MSTNPRWPRGGWTGTPAPPPPPNPHLALAAEAILERTEGDPLKFLCFTNSEPGGFAYRNLPGATPEARVGYFVDYLEAGYAIGLTAWELIGGRHDSATLSKAFPRTAPGEPRIEDPEKAVKFYFPEDWYDSIGRYSMEKALAENPGAADSKLAFYRKRAGV